MIEWPLFWFGEPSYGFQHILMASKTMGSGHCWSFIGPGTILAIALLSVEALAEDSPSGTPEVPAVIFDTDIGSDCDDAGALAALVRAKVDRWVAMGTGGWNFQAVGMAAYCEELLDKWPMPFYISPSGKQIITGHRRLPKTPQMNPVREAYRLWVKNALLKGRSSWDQVAVLSIARPELFNLQHTGRVECKPNAEVVWNPDVDNPSHHLLTPKVSTDKMAEIIEELMARTPRARASAR